MEINQRSSSLVRSASGYTTVSSHHTFLPPQTDLLCSAHAEIPVQVCTHDLCQKRLICQKCISTHPESHKVNILSYQEVLNGEIFTKIDQEITLNSQLDHKKSTQSQFLNQLKSTLNDIGKRVEKSLGAIYINLKEKALSNFPEPLYSTNEWERIKKSLVEKRLDLPKANLGKDTNFLEEYVKAYSRASVALLDSENERDLKNPSGIKMELLDPPVVHQELIDETIKNLRRVLNDFFTPISMQISSNTPEENIIRSKMNIQNYNDLNINSCGVTPRFLLSSRKGSMIGPSFTSIPQMMPGQMQFGAKTIDKSLSIIRNGNLEKNKSMGPEEQAVPWIPPFVYDEYLETEVVDLPYIGPLKMDDGNLYRGQMRDRKKHGKGKLIYKDGRIYEGYFCDDQPQGKGRMIHPDNDIYEGQWSNGMAHGEGTYTKANGWTYEGSWYQDQPHGKGTETWSDGSQYKGDFDMGIKNGRGTFKGADGSYYIGDFLNNLFHGEGKYTWIDGRKYTGTWYKNIREGRGIMTWVDGRKYDGEYKNDVKHGFGRYEWADGKKYIGTWFEGKQHGHGKIEIPHSKGFNGQWEHGKLLDEFEAIISPGRNGSTKKERTPELHHPRSHSMEPIEMDSHRFQSVKDRKPEIVIQNIDYKEDKFVTPPKHGFENPNPRKVSFGQIELAQSRHLTPSKNIIPDLKVITEESLHTRSILRPEGKSQELEI